MSPIATQAECYRRDQAQHVVFKYNTWYSSITRGIQVVCEPKVCRGGRRSFGSEYTCIELNAYLENSDVVWENSDVMGVNSNDIWEEIVTVIWENSDAMEFFNASVSN